MKNIILNLLSENGNKSGSKFLKKRSLMKDYSNSDSANMEYNPKTARHKSLKNLNISFFRD